MNNVPDELIAAGMIYSNGALVIGVDRNTAFSTLNRNQRYCLYHQREGTFEFERK
eukprot:gene6108-10115_t